MINFIVMITIGIMLLGAGIADIKSLKIRRAFIILFFAICLLAVITQDTSNILISLSGMLIGICVIGISMISAQQVGRGDGYIVAALGMAIGFRNCLVVVCTASVIMCVIAIIMLVLKLGSRKTRLPFIPAVFVGYVVLLSGNLAM